MQKFIVYLLAACVVMMVCSSVQAQTCGTGEVTGFRWPLDNHVVSCRLNDPTGCGYQTGYGTTAYNPALDHHHMGIDIVPAVGQVLNAPVFAPCTGILKEAQIHKGYGSTIILECEANDGCVSVLLAHMYPPADAYPSDYTDISLHLRYNQSDVSRHTTIEIGDLLGYLTSQRLNGGWSPHSHIVIRKGAYHSGNYLGCSGTWDDKIPQAQQTAANMNPVWYYGGYAYDCWSRRAELDLHNPNDFIPAHPATPPLPGYTIHGPAVFTPAFQDAYTTLGGEATLGLPFNVNGGTPYVHVWGSDADGEPVNVQDFVLGDTWSVPVWTQLVYNPSDTAAYLVATNMLNWYAHCKNDGDCVTGYGDGDRDLHEQFYDFGIPLGPEYHCFTQTHPELVDRYLRQDFDNGSLCLYLGTALSYNDCSACSRISPLADSGGAPQDDEDAIVHIALTYDPDGDGYPATQNGQVFDCNNNNAAVSPTALENCSDGIDNNCNGATDAADPQCNSADPCAAQPLPTTWTVEDDGSFMTPSVMGPFMLVQRMAVAVHYSAPASPNGTQRWLQLRYNNNMGMELVTPPTPAGIDATWVLNVQLQENGVPVSHRIGVLYSCAPYASSTDGIQHGTMTVSPDPQSPEAGLATLAYNAPTNWYHLRAFSPRGQCSQGMPPEFERCDNADNDCDGQTDEDTGATTCGVGVCFHTENNCLNGEVHACNPLQGAQDEVCDGIDNNCDDDIDEDHICDPVPLDCSAGALLPEDLVSFLCTPRSETDSDCVRVNLTYTFDGTRMPQDWVQLCADFAGGAWRCTQKKDTPRDGVNTLTWWGNVAVGDYTVDMNMSCEPYDPSLPSAEAQGILTARAENDVAPWYAGFVTSSLDQTNGRWHVSVSKTPPPEPTPTPTPTMQPTAVPTVSTPDGGVAVSPVATAHPTPAHTPQPVPTQQSGAAACNADFSGNRDNRQWPKDLPEKLSLSCAAGGARIAFSYRIPHSAPPYSIDVVVDSPDIDVQTKMLIDLPDYMLLTVSCLHAEVGTGPYHFSMVITSLKNPLSVYRYGNNIVTVKERTYAHALEPSKVVEITTRELPVAHLNTVYCEHLAHTGNPQSCTFLLNWSIVLPREISFDSKLGVFSGTPTDLYDRWIGIQMTCTSPRGADFKNVHLKVLP